MAGALEAWRLGAEPYYQPAGDECRLFEAAFVRPIPVLLKGPTGCGKTRFVEHMAWRMRRPLITVACHEDLGAADLVGRWLLDADGTRWQDGPLTLAARHGAICYLDELIEGTAILTNGPSDGQRRKLKATGLDQEVDHVAIGEEIGFSKPAAQAFHKRSSNASRPPRPRH